jgi:putative oxidoreductase
MTRQVPRPLLNLILRLILGIVFIYSGLVKIWSPFSFADSIASYHILPSGAINVLAIGLPPLEIISGLLLLAGIYIRVGILTISSMLTLFSIALLSTIIRGISIDCGCFGKSSWLDSNPWFALIRDLLLLWAGIYLYVYYLAMSRDGTNIVLKASSLDDATSRLNN